MEQNNNTMSDSQGPANVVRLHKNDRPTEWVTAFTDRAEVTRMLKTKVAAGKYMQYNNVEASLTQKRRSKRDRHCGFAHWRRQKFSSRYWWSRIGYYLRGMNVMNIWI